MNFIIFSAVGFIKTFEFAALLGGICLAIVNFFYSYQPADPINTTFILVNFLAIGMVLIGLKMK